jgi:hypothetical protein
MPDALAWMGCGGYWNDRPRGFLNELVRRKTCPVLQKGNNITEEAAWKFVKAMQWGGLTTAEAWDVIRVHDCERWGYDVQVQRLDELPDRWFRDAWTRKGSNSGVVRVDLEKAKPLQWRKLLHAVSQENKRRELDLYAPAPIKLNKATYQNAIKHARDDEELRRIWEPSLPRL